jgi:hypothetical protein
VGVLAGVFVVVFVDNLVIMRTIMSASPCQPAKRVLSALSAHSPLVRSRPWISKTARLQEEAGRTAQRAPSRNSLSRKASQASHASASRPGDCISREGRGGAFSHARFLSIKTGTVAAAADGRLKSGKEGDKCEVSEIEGKHGLIKMRNEISVGFLAMICEG